jgi:hypothetical protein
MEDMTMPIYYAGIGSRKTPDFILDLMTKLASRLEELGFVLRSGGAEGADLAFESGVRDIWNKQIFIPWPGFNNRPKGRVCDWIGHHEEHEVIARMHHPNWAACSQGARLLHIRNVAQVLGPDTLKASHSAFVLCWTEAGAGYGGTGQALRIARAYDIPIFDLDLPDRKEVLVKLSQHVERLTTELQPQARERS